MSPYGDNSYSESYQIVHSAFKSFTETYTVWYRFINIFVNIIPVGVENLTCFFCSVCMFNKVGLPETQSDISSKSFEF